MKSLLNLYFLTMGCVGAFAITPIMPLPLLIGIVILMAVWVMRARTLEAAIVRHPSPAVNILFYGIALIMIASYFRQNLEMGFSEKALKHLLSYFTVILIFYYAIFHALAASALSINDLFRLISRGVLLCAMFAVVEFVLKNFFSFGSLLDDLTLRPLYAPLYAVDGHAFIRARSLAEESGHFAMYVVMFAPFALYHYLHRGKTVKAIAVFLLIALAVSVTFSAGAFLSITFSLLATICCYLYHTRRNKALKIILVALAGCTITSLFLLLNDSYSFLDAVMSKLTFEDTRSAQDRLRRWLFALDLIGQKPLLGWGPGISALLTDSGIVNLYLELFTQFGGLGFIPWISLFILFANLVLQIKGNVRFVYLFSITAAFVHYAAISNYWFPWLWTLFALISYQLGLQRQTTDQISQLEYESENPARSGEIEGAWR